MGESGSGERLGGGAQAPAPARRRKGSTGVTALKRDGGKQVYRIAFSYRGVQCRELLTMPHSKANEAYCVRLRGAIVNKIQVGDFRYEEYFPDSPRAAVFGHATPRGKLTLKAKLEAYRDRTEKTLERSTWLCYRRDIDNVLVKRWGETDIRNLSRGDLRDWIGTLTVGLKRIQNLLLPLRNVLTEAVEDQVIPASPLEGLKIRRLVAPEQRDSDYEPDPYTQDQLATLLGNLDGIERWTFQAWAYLGLRTSELVGLRWASVDLEARVVTIREVTTVGRDKARTKTKSGVRAIPMLPAALEAIQGMRAHTQLAGDRFTVNPRGRRKDPFWDTNKLASVWARAHRGTGIKIRNPYQLRHTFASQLLSQGENIAHIARLLGHKNTEMVTRTYGKWVAEGERLGFDRPPRRYGMEPLWAAERTGT